MTNLIQEQKRLEAYLKDRKLNLPEIIYLDDHSVKVAVKRLKELSELIADEKERESIIKAEQAEEIEASRVLLESNIQALRDVKQLFKDSFTDLHPQSRARSLEITQAISGLRV